MFSISIAKTNGHRTLDYDSIGRACAGRRKLNFLNFLGDDGPIEDTADRQRD